jgi:CPA2 family monovalent cation:H+ antiporter-2
MIDSINLQIVLILTVGFALAALFGYLSFKLKLSPILGYLLAGYAIGPYSPGFVADVHIAEQLAEIGVILMMFGVGLHFRVEELSAVKNIAIPGGIVQALMATVVGAYALWYFGAPIESSIVYGLAISVASTVVMMRMLTDYKLLDTVQGHVAVGWAIVEDIITIFILILLPSLATASQGGGFDIQDLFTLIAIAIVKCIILALLMFSLGRFLISNALATIINTHSTELFTLTILAVTFLIATGASYVFGTSIALGAFLSGLVMAETNVRKRIYNNALPIKDTFVVVFFLSVGMLFNPLAVVENLGLFIATLGVILIVKPLAAYLITIILKHPLKTAVTVGIALSQIGEFSFIVAEEALKFKILSDDAYDILVAASLTSIALNPIFFRIFQNYLGVTPTKTGPIPS